ncbi:MAG: hypothetical protein ACOCW9_05685 [Thermodesulfobacteriota bacterium]
MPGIINTIQNGWGIGILLSAVFVFLSLLSPPGVRSAEVTLGWDPPEDDRVAGYRIFYGEAGTDFKVSPKITVYEPEETQTRIFDLEEGIVYAFAATSFDDFHRESEFSEVLLYRIPEAGRPNDGGDVIDDEELFDSGEDSGGGGGGCFIQGIQP